MTRSRHLISWSAPVVRLLMAAVVPAFSFLLPRPVHAAIAEWRPLGSPSANFGDSGSWNSGNGPVPGILDTARFSTLAGPYAATFNVNTANAALQVLNGIVTFQTDGAARTYNITGAATISASTLTLGISAARLSLKTVTMNVNTTATLNISGGNYLSTSSTFKIGTNGAGTASVTADGANSTLDIFGATTLGDNSAIANLTLQNGAIGIFSDLILNDSASSAQQANMLVASGASVNAFGNVSVGKSTQNGQTSTLLVTGANTQFKQLGDVFLSVGAAAGNNNPATFTIENGATYISGIRAAGTASVAINKSGALNINSGATFNSRGDFTIDGGTMVKSADAIFILADNATFTATGSAQVTFNDFYAISNGSTFNIKGGADFATTGFLDIGNGSNGTLTVSGAGSTFTTTGIPYWGANGGNASVTFSNGAAAIVNSALNISATGLPSNTTVLIDSGATMSVGTLKIATPGISRSVGSLEVAGAGSSITQTGSSAMEIGHASSGTGRLTINGGTFTSGTGGIAINRTGALNINSGAFIAKANMLFNAGATFAIGGTPNAWSGKLDLTTASAVFQTTDTSDKAATLARLANQITTAKHGGLWDAQGITSTNVKNDTAHNTTLALVDNADFPGQTSFQGMAVTSDSLFIVRAVIGDADLSGTVDLLDFDIWFRHLGFHTFSYGAGDLNTDGTVDLLDFDIWFSHLGFSGPNLEPKEGNTAGVPEPASVMLLALGSIALLKRRRPY